MVLGISPFVHEWHNLNITIGGMTWPAALPKATIITRPFILVDLEYTFFLPVSVTTFSVSLDQVIHHFRQCCKFDVVLSTSHSSPLAT